MRERDTVVGSVCVCVCVCMCLGKISFYIRLCKSFVVPTVYTRQMVDLKRVDFVKNARVESYDDKYLILGHLCGGREHHQIVFVWRGKFDCTPRQRK